MQGVSLMEVHNSAIGKDIRSDLSLVRPSRSLDQAAVPSEKAPIDIN